MLSCYTTSRCAILGLVHTLCRGPRQGPWGLSLSMMPKVLTPNAYVWSFVGTGAFSSHFQLIFIGRKIAAELVKKKLPVTLITGVNTDPDERDAITQKLNKVDESVIVATIDSLKEGVDITGFQLTLFAEIDWRAWALEQAEGRTRRIGQEKNVRWIYFFFDKGVDRLMRKKIEEKNELAKSVRATAERA